ncbi:MAG: hypothetical protein OXO49_04420 [Gammaproteobacteria bacterium]|nr:hypothetical protein [Gammaproteobacteria bacterium]MDE0252230.1 hypothetical protein [Gammaproteobacteria bacterium]MDE0402661.1 hypothetical protein [Gammaproteobacteria bacterium]
MCADVKTRQSGRSIEPIAQEFELLVLTIWNWLDAAIGVPTVADDSPEQHEFASSFGWRYGLGMMLVVFPTSVRTYVGSDKALGGDRNKKR